MSPVAEGVGRRIDTIPGKQGRVCLGVMLPGHLHQVIQMVVIKVEHLDLRPESVIVVVGRDISDANVPC